MTGEAASRTRGGAKGDNREQTPGLAISSGLGAASSFVVEWGLPAR